MSCTSFLKTNVWIRLENYQQKLRILITASSPLAFLLLAVHNMAATTTKRIKTPPTDATMGVAMLLCFFFFFLLLWSASHKYGFWSTLRQIHSKSYKSYKFSIDTSIRVPYAEIFSGWSGTTPLFNMYTKKSSKFNFIGHGCESRTQRKIYI